MSEKQNLLDEPVFESPRMIREFCENARKVLRPVYLHLALTADELEAVLRDHPTVGPSRMGMDARVRARLVAGHMRRAAEGLGVASIELPRTFTSYRKHFLEPLQADRGRQRRQFDVNDQ